VIKLTKAQTYLGLIATIIAIVGGAGYAWRTVGWMTPSGHEESLHEHQNTTLSAIQAVSIKIDVNQAQWLCDENSEELVDLLEAQSVEETAERSVKIESVREKMRKLDCTRFED
jgi:hypothetical protein